MNKDKEYKDNKINLYIDIDSTIINTAETFINKYCREHNIKKDFYDLKDWEFKSIDRNFNIKEFLQYIETDDFFNEVQFYDDFLRFYVKNGDKYIFNFITIGSEKNLILKKRFLHKSLPTLQNVNFIGFTTDKTKNSVDMTNGIQIDDKYENLDTNARLKILQKNYIDTDYNKEEPNREDLYIMDNWKQISETLDFINNHRELFF